MREDGSVLEEKEFWGDNKSGFRRHWILTVIFVLVILGLIGALIGDEPEITGNAVNVPDSSSKEESEEVNENPKEDTSDKSIYSMNENVPVDYLNYQVEKVETFTKMGSTVYNKETNGKFIKVYLEITNNAKETREIFTPRFKIMDSKGRQYERVYDDMLYISDYLEFGKQLQPSLTAYGAIVFELPKDAEDLRLIITGDWLSYSGEVVKLSNVEDIGKDTTQQEEINEMWEEAQNTCSSPFKCSSTCVEYMDVGQKDCPDGEVCCMEDD